MLVDFLFSAAKFLHKVILLFLLIFVASGVVIIPLVPIAFFMQPSLESLFAALALIGLWPMCIAVTYSAFFIGHFIERSLPKGADERYDLYPGASVLYVRLAIEAGDTLENALENYGDILDVRTRQRGKKLIDHHRAIARYVLPGMAVTAVGGIGLMLMNVLEIPTKSTL